MRIETAPVFEPLLHPRRYKGAKGGRGSGKSHYFAEAVVEAMILNPDCSVVAIREIQKSLKFSAKRLIEEKIEQHRVQSYFDITLNEIRSKHGNGVVIFMGMQDHTADSIKSLEGFDIAWVEEAQSISERSMELLLPTIRKENSEVWFSWNPTNDADPIEKFFKAQSDDKIVVHANYLDNPFLPKTLLDEAERHKKERPDTFNHVWLGDFITFGEIFTRDMFRQAQYKPQDLEKYIAVDVAMSLDEGADRSSITIVGLDKASNIYVIETQAGRWTSHELKQKIIEACRFHQPFSVGIEKTTASWHFVESFREMMRVQNVFVPFEELKPSGRAKQKRIESYVLSAIQQSRLFFIDKPNEDLIHEAVNFPNGAHDDMLDSLSYAIEMAFSRPRIGYDSTPIVDDNFVHGSVF